MSALKALRKTKQAKKTEAPKKKTEPKTASKPKQAEAPKQAEPKQAEAISKEIVVIVNKTRNKTLMELKVPKNWVNKRSTDHPDPDTPKARLGGYERSLNQLIRFFHTKKDRDNFVSSLTKKQATDLFELMYSEYKKGNFNHVNLNDYIASWNEVYPNEACDTVGKLGSSKGKPKAIDKRKKTEASKASKPKSKPKKQASERDMPSYEEYLEYKRWAESR